MVVNGNDFHFFKTKVIFQFVSPPSIFKEFFTFSLPLKILSTIYFLAATTPTSFVDITDQL